MYQPLDLPSWNRREHYQFFSQFDFPYFDICTTVDCTVAYKKAKDDGLSFFSLYLYYSLFAANETAAFRYRVRNNEVVVYDEVHASPTISRQDGTFGFAYIDFSRNRERFFQNTATAIEQTRQQTGLEPAVSGENVIHYSVLPWISFTSISHARHTAFKDSIPKITFGKLTETATAFRMPVSVSVHHGLMDGWQVSQYIDRFQELLLTLPE